MWLGDIAIMTIQDFGVVKEGIRVQCGGELGKVATVVFENMPA